MFDLDQIHAFGSDDDKVWVAPVGSTAPTALSNPADPWEHVGFLGEDSLSVSPSDSVEKFRVHQGGKVVKTKMSESATSFTFIAVQDNPLTAGMQHRILQSTTTAGVTRQRMSSGRVVEARAFIVDLFDDDVHVRYEIPNGQLGERQEISFTRSALTAYSFTVEIIGDWYRLTNDPAFATT